MEMVEARGGGGERKRVEIKVDKGAGSCREMEWLWSRGSMGEV